MFPASAELKSNRNNCVPVYPATIIINENNGTYMTKDMVRYQELIVR
jgi:hypothetical protein